MLSIIGVVLIAADAGGTTCRGSVYQTPYLPSGCKAGTPSSIAEILHSPCARREATPGAASRKQTEGDPCQRLRGGGGGGAAIAGLVNMGNTCYFNSVLQALVHSPALKSEVLDNKGGSRGGEGKVTAKFVQLLRKMWESNEGNRWAAKISSADMCGWTLENTDEFWRRRIVILHFHPTLISSFVARGVLFPRIVPDLLICTAPYLKLPMVQESRHALWTPQLSMRGGGTLQRVRPAGLARALPGERQACIHVPRAESCDAVVCYMSLCRCRKHLAIAS